MGAAQARDWHDRNRNGEAIGLGLLGLATGVIIGSAIANDRRVPDYGFEPAPPVRYYPPRPQIIYVPERVRTFAPARPWTRAWYYYCTNHYRSFDPNRGTYIGYDGREHFCTAN
jgi:hypothetical protein